MRLWTYLWNLLERVLPDWTADLGTDDGDEEVAA